MPDAANDRTNRMGIAIVKMPLLLFVLRFLSERMSISRPTTAVLQPMNVKTNLTSSPRTATPG